MSAPNSHTVSMVDADDIMVQREFDGFAALVLFKGHSAESKAKAEALVAAWKAQPAGPSEREAAIDECRDAAHDAIHHAIERMDLCAFVKGHVDEALLALKNNAAPQATANLASRPNAVASEDVTAAALPAGAAPSGAWRCPTCSATCIPHQAKPEAGADDARDAARYRARREQEWLDSDEYQKSVAIEDAGSITYATKESEYARYDLDSDDMIAEQSATDRDGGTNG